MAPMSLSQKKSLVKKTLEPGTEEDEETMDVLFEDEFEPGDDEEEDGENNELETKELKEVFAVDWKEKQKTLEVKKNRGWKPLGGGKG